jgi:hypothetical protein
MNKIIGIILSGLLIISCNGKTTENQTTKENAKFNQELKAELKQMAEIDQIAAYIPQGKYLKLTEEEWMSFKDSVFTTNQKRIKEIFNQYGFVGVDLAGKEGTNNFWLLVQHSDHTPEFQKEVLVKMKLEVEKGNAEPGNYGLLVDRVRINSGQKQVYGTQVAYNSETGQAYPNNLEDSLNVNERRKSVGLDPLENYLNDMTKMHFEMNKQSFLDRGITKPKLYKTE